MGKQRLSSLCISVSDMINEYLDSVGRSVPGLVCLIVLCCLVSKTFLSIYLFVFNIIPCD